MVKKGYIFTTDALIALSVIVLTLIVASSIYLSRPGSMLNKGYFSQDLLDVLSDMNINETNNAYVASLITGGVITNLDNSVLEQIGEFWAEGQQELAVNIFSNLSEGLIPENYGYGLWIDDELIYERNTTAERNLITSKSMISGISKNKTREGYNARAFARKTRKNTNLIVKGDVVSSSVRKPGAGNNLNEVYVTYKVNLPNDATIIDAYWFIEAAWTDNKFKAYINGVHIPGSDASGSKLLTDVEPYVSPGENEALVVFRYGSGGREGGDDGASHFVVEYSTDEMNTLQQLTQKYFGEVISNCSIRYKKPVFALNEIKSIDVSMNVVGTTARLWYVVDGISYNISTKNITQNEAEWSNYEIKSAMESEGINYSDLTGKYFWFVVDVDDYNSIEAFGAGRKIFSGSYVDVDFELTKEVYGHIDLTRVVPVYAYSSAEMSDFYRNVEWRYNLSTNDTDLMALDSQFAWLYRDGTNPSQEVISNSNTLYSHPPSPLIKELARFGLTQDNGGISDGENVYKLMFGSGYGINPFNSLVDFTILIKGMVPYGSTFPTKELAVNDAVQRLQEVLGDFINATEIENETISIPEVPSMWGPAIAEVRTWH
jgi:hypothetical protein